MNETNGNRCHSSIDVLENTPEDDATTFYDPTNPAFASATRIDRKKQKTWKSKLAIWTFVLFLIVGGAAVLYLLLRVNRVNVRVQADSNRDTLNARAEPNPKTTESGLSADAINIARQALGSDTPATPGAAPLASPNASPSASPSSDANFRQLLTFTDNSPAYQRAIDENASSSKVAETNSTALQSSTPEVSVPLVQSRANVTQTLFVEDLPLKTGIAAQPNGLVTAAARLNEKETPKPAPPVLPPFGTMLPVRTLGVIFSLRNNAFARFELSRDCKGDGWSLSKGTLLIGQVRGSEYDRAYVTIVGYIDLRTNRLVKINGEVLGNDGGAGVPGKRTAIDRNRLKQTLSKVASGGLQVAGMMAGALTGRGTVVLNGAGYRVLNPITDEAGQIVGASNEKRSFVKVEAGQAAYVMVSDLPNEIKAVDAPGEGVWTEAATSLTDREVMELILLGTPEEMRAALPRMDEDQRKLAMKTMGPEKDK
jgi:hypothetical protein